MIFQSKRILMSFEIKYKRIAQRMDISMKALDLVFERLCLIIPKMGSQADP